MPWEEQRRDSARAAVRREVAGAGVARPRPECESGLWAPGEVRLPAGEPAPPGAEGEQLEAEEAPPEAAGEPPEVAGGLPRGEAAAPVHLVVAEERQSAPSSAWRAAATMCGWGREALRRASRRTHVAVRTASSRH